MTNAKMVRCYCQSFEFGTWTADVPDGADPGDFYETYETGCTQFTTKTFAQGHDAKLAGFLVRAELGGEEIRLVGGGVVHTFSGAEHAAATISEAMAAKVSYQLAAARERLAKKELREASKARKAKAPAVAAAPTNRTATIKVGRWTYDAEISPTSHAAYYTTKSGEGRIAEQGTYTEM